MNNLWLFGDSFTAGHGCTPGWEYYENYRKDGDLLWGEILEKELKLNLINCGLNGSSNDKIIDRIIHEWNNIGNDVVIIGVTYHHRYDIPKENSLHTIFLDLEKLTSFFEYYTQEEKETIINFQYYFSQNILYKERQHSRLQFLKERLIETGVKVILWNVENDIGGIDIIKNATKGKIDDGHFSYLGHRQFANKLLTNYFFDSNLI